MRARVAPASLRLGGASLPALLILAAGLRLLSLHVYEFDFDNAYSAYLALQFLDEGRFPLQSLYSTFLFANPPWMAYLQMVPLAVWSSPYAVVVPITLLNALGVYFVSRLTEEMVGRRAAVVAGLLYAASPWIVHYSRRSWHPGLYPVLVPATAYFLITALRSPAPQGRLVAGLACFGLLTQTSLIGFLAAPQVAFTLWLGRRRFRPRWIAAGVLLLAAMSVPYAIGLAMDYQGVAGRVDAYARGTAAADLEALRHAVRLVTGHMYAQTFFDDGGTGYRLLAGLAEGVHWALLATLALGAGLTLRKIRAHRDDRPGEVALLAWLVLPVLIMTVHKSTIFPRYLLITAPAGLVLVARALASVSGGGGRRPLAFVGPALAAAIFTAQLVQHHAFLQTHTGFDLDHLNLRGGRALGGRIDALAARTGAEEILVRMHTATLSALAGRVLPTYGDFDGPSAWVLRAGTPTLYVVQGEAPGLLPRYLRPAGEPLDLPHQHALHFYATPAVDAERVLAEVDLPVGVTFANGLRLLGLDVARVLENPAELALVEYWQLARPELRRTDTSYSVYNRLVDAEERLVAQEDGFYWDPTRWREGDILVQRYALRLDGTSPPRALTLRIGTYDLETLRPAPIVDGPEPGADGVALSLEGLP